MSFVPLLNNAILSINAGRAKLGQMLCARLLAGFCPLKKPKPISRITEGAVAVLACHRLAAVDIPQVVLIQSFHKITPQSNFCVCSVSLLLWNSHKNIFQTCFISSGLLHYNIIKLLCQVKLLNYYSADLNLYCQYKMNTGGQTL